MSAQQKPEPGTEIQLAASVAVGALPPEMQRALEVRKLQNQIAGKLAEMNWGRQLDLPTRRAIADWGQQFRVDVTTEIHVLGSNVYLNANFYNRHLGEMIAAGLIEYAYADHVEDDPRLVKLGADGEGERSRRLRERIMHSIPDEAKSAVVFRIKPRALDKEIVGVKWCGGGTRKNDPVGESFPVETSETRSCRRAMRLLASHVPSASAAQIETIQASAELLTERMAEHREQEAARIATHEAKSLAAGRSAMPASQAPLVDASNPYSAIDESRVPVRGQVATVETVVGQPPTAAQLATAAMNADAADPYESGATAGQGTSGAPGGGDVGREEVGTGAPASSSSVRLPFRQGASEKGTPLADVATKDLSDAVRFAGDVVKYAAFVEDAKDELERRRLEAEDTEG